MSGCKGNRPFRHVVKSIFAKNTYLNDWFYRTFCMRGSNMSHLYDRFASDDSIADVSILREFRSSLDSGGVFYTTNVNEANATMYGIWESMFGKNCKCPVYATPAIEHGLIFHDYITSDILYTARATQVVMGDFRYKVVRRYKDTPIFRVGPYIHYADSFYSAERIQALKKELGSVLLVMPMHSTDAGEVSHEEKDFLDEVDRIAKRFDTVWVNAFWWNLNDALIRSFESKGYRIVSAGFRADVNFLPRLKTLFLLSDLVVGDGIGTHIGYLMDMCLPYRYVPYGHTILDSDMTGEKDAAFVNNNKARIASAFVDSESITQEQLDVCEPYWGLSHTKTEEDLKEICRITEEIVHIAKGRTARFGTVARELISTLGQSNPRSYRLLTEAMR